MHDEQYESIVDNRPNNTGTYSVLKSSCHEIDNHHD